MSHPLEGLCGSADLAVARVDRKFPVRGGHMCLSAGFVIGAPVCHQRQEQDRAEPARGLCERGACHHYIAKPDAKPSRPGVEHVEREMNMPKTEERKHKYGDRPLPEGATVTILGAVVVGTNHKIPCPACETGWMNQYGKAKTCSACSLAARKADGRMALQLEKARQAKADALADRKHQAKAAEPSPDPYLPSTSSFNNASERAAATIQAAPEIFELKDRAMGAGLHGCVTDQGGSALPNVLIKVTGPRLQGFQGAATGQDGRFCVPFLPVGLYAVRCETEGYAVETRHLALSLGEDADLSFVLTDETMNPIQRAIWDECEALAEMLMAKNRAYGNSALDPVRVFSKADPEEQIRVRLDDKLSRLMRGEAAGEDTEQDFMGYLVLLRVHRRMRAEKGAAA